MAYKYKKNSTPELIKRIEEEKKNYEEAKGSMTEEDRIFYEEILKEMQVALAQRSDA
jgi:hypothetical protein